MHVHIHLDGAPLRSARGDWVFGSHKLPNMQGAAYVQSPFPLDNRASRVINSGKLERLTRPAMVPVRDLYVWQHYLEAGRISLPLKTNAAIFVVQLDNRLIILNGNHRSSAAYAEGRDYIRADYANLDDPAFRAFRNDLDTPKPLAQRSINPRVRLL